MQNKLLQSKCWKDLLGKLQIEWGELLWLDTHIIRNYWHMGFNSTGCLNERISSLEETDLKGFRINQKGCRLLYVATLCHRNMWYTMKHMELKPNFMEAFELVTWTCFQRGATELKNRCIFYLSNYPQDSGDKILMVDIWVSLKKTGCFSQLSPATFSLHHL